MDSAVALLMYDIKFPCSQMSSAPPPTPLVFLRLCLLQTICLFQICTGPLLGPHWLTLSTRDSSSAVSLKASWTGRTVGTLTDRVLCSITHHILGKVVSWASVVEWKKGDEHFTNCKKKEKQFNTSLCNEHADFVPYCSCCHIPDCTPLEHHCHPSPSHRLVGNSRSNTLTHVLAQFAVHCRKCRLNWTI